MNVHYDARERVINYARNLHLFQYFLWSQVRAHYCRWLAHHSIDLGHDATPIELWLTELFRKQYEDDEMVVTIHDQLFVTDRDGIVYPMPDHARTMWMTEEQEAWEQADDES